MYTLQAPLDVTRQTESDRCDRLSIVGKFIHVVGERFLVRGVTYGTFAPDEQGGQFPSRGRVAADFAAMASAGINTIRTYTVPDSWLLDEACAHGLKVMVGIPWMQHVAFLGTRSLEGQIRREVAAQARQVAAHPSVVLVALGNEIPPGVVRWHGARAIARFLRELYCEAKAANPEGLYTYVNFPTTEYLELPFVDVCAFNLYLHREKHLRRYLARLQHIAGGKPLLLAEAGIDSIREGEMGQAEMLAMQLRVAFAEGLCGAVAFAWTDEWWRGGCDVDGWAFGLVTRERKPKPALARASRVFLEAPFTKSERRTWPLVSVVVCAYNAADTIEECLASLERLTYPHVEIIVVNDGSRDETRDIVRRHRSVNLIETPNGGLAAARNVGLSKAKGEIVAYTDADVRVDPDWLTYLVQPFLTSEVVGVGGPNVVPPDDPWVAQCVARSPGGPTHVLLNDRIAEHIPGCNMAFRREPLLAIGGFNPIYLRAGDDVDVCWRLQQRGGILGFAPAALVWHRHRTSVRAFWRQQVGYGEGQQWLVPQHPDKFAGSHIIWRGHIYSHLPGIHSISRRVVNSGQWGTAPFPSVYRVGAPFWAYGPHSARWQATMLASLVAGVAAIAVGAASGWALLLLGASGLGVTLMKCIRYALATDIGIWPGLEKKSPFTRRLLCRGLITFLHLMQPIARARGQLRGLMSAPGRPLERMRQASRPSAVELRRALRLLLGQRIYPMRYWSEQWTSCEALLSGMLSKLRSARLTRMLEVDSGWNPGRDISIGVGFLAWLDLRALVEEHASGKCLVRVSESLRPTLAARLLVGAVILLLLSTWNAATTPQVTVIAGVVLLSLMVKFVWRVSQTVAVTERSLGLLMAEREMIPLGDAALQAASSDARHPIRSRDLSALPVRATGVVKAQVRQDTPDSLTDLAGASPEFPISAEVGVATAGAFDAPRESSRVASVRAQKPML